MDKKEKENLQDLLEKYYEDEANDSDSSEVTKNMLNQLEDDSDEEYGPCTDEDHGQDTDGINIYDLDLPEGDTLYENLYDEGLEDAEIKIDSEGNVLTYGLLPGDTICFVDAFTDSFPRKDQQEVTEYLKNAYDDKVNRTDTDSSDEENNSDSGLDIEDVTEFIDFLVNTVSSIFDGSDEEAKSIKDKVKSIIDNSKEPQNYEKDTSNIKNTMKSILSDLEKRGVIEKDTGVSSQVKEPDDIKDFSFTKENPIIAWKEEDFNNINTMLVTNVILEKVARNITFYNKDNPIDSLKIPFTAIRYDDSYNYIFIELASPIFYGGDKVYAIRLRYDKDDNITEFKF